MLVVVVAGFLLLSMGGAIVAAPLTLPLLWLVGHRRPKPAVRLAAAAIAALTVGEVVWLGVYNAAGEAKPAIWLVPLAAASVTAVAFGRQR